MAVTYPMPLASFFDKLMIDETSCELEERLGFNETEGGEMIPVGRGSRFWAGTASIAGGADFDSGRYSLLMAKATAAEASFLMRPVNRIGPQGNASGSLFTSEAGLISTINTARDILRIEGTAANFDFKEGDFFRVTSGGRHHVHQIDGAFRSTGAGVLSAVQIYPALLPNVLTGSIVRFRNPYMKAKVVPGSFNVPKEGVGKLSGFSFKWRQVHA